MHSIWTRRICSCRFLGYAMPHPHSSPVGAPTVDSFTLTPRSRRKGTKEQGSSDCREKQFAVAVWRNRTFVLFRAPHGSASWEASSTIRQVWLLVKHTLSSRPYSSLEVWTMQHPPERLLDQVRHRRQFIAQFRARIVLGERHQGADGDLTGAPAGPPGPGALVGRDFVFEA